MPRIIYRQSHEFPPNEDSYESVFERRIRKHQQPFSNATMDRASRGLSVIDTLEAARIHARKNKRNGSILVRYILPDDLEFRVEHLTGDAHHLTIELTTLTDLSEYLDAGWWEVQDFTSGTVG